MINNLGTMIFFYILYPVLMIFHAICAKFCRCMLCCRKMQKSLKRTLYYKLIIGVIFESYALVALSCCVGLQILNFSSPGLIVQSVTCLFFSVFIISMPFMMIKHVVQNFAALEEYKMKKRVGTLYDELNLRKGVKIFLQPVFFLLRRLILICTIVFLRGFLVGQISVIILQSMISLSILTYIKAFQSK